MMRRVCRAAKYALERVKESSNMRASSSASLSVEDNCTGMELLVVYRTLKGR